MKPFTTAQRLKQLMQSRGLRQIDILNAAKPFCEKHGVRLGKNDLSQYISGKVIPRQDKLSILGMALNVSEAWLMGYEVPAERAAAPGDDISAQKAELMERVKRMTDDELDRLDQILRIVEDNK